MTWFEFFIVFVVFCAISFIIRLVWVKGIDFIISALKKGFGRPKKEQMETWHSLEEIRKQNNK